MRLVAAVVLVLAGAALLAGGVLLAGAGSGAGVLSALCGGVLSFTGVLVGAVFVVPRTVGALGRLAAVVGGGPAWVATANAVRNPRRTTATTSALLIGVTLVVLMVVGADSTRATLDAALDRTYPVDVSIGPTGPGPTGPGPTGPGAAGAPGAEAALAPGLARAVSGTRGVRSVAPLTAVRATVRPAPGGGSGGGPGGGPGGGTTGWSVTVPGVDPARGRAAVADAGALAPLAQGAAVVPAGVAGVLHVRSGQQLVLAVGPAQRTLTAQVTALPGNTLVVPAPDLAALAPDAPTTRLWVRLGAGADPAAVVERVRDEVGRAAGDQDAVPVVGSAVDRAGYAKVIDTMLLVVVALLAVAVVIALIGVANTLPLSVVERTRESALLRALGLTRGQLRRILALEGALVAGVGALLGVVLGTVYGWAGTASLLGDAAGGPVRLAVPWPRVAAVLGVAVAAGLLASVLPGRRAARTPPAAALGE